MVRKLTWHGRYRANMNLNSFGDMQVHNGSAKDTN